MPTSSFFFILSLTWTYDPRWQPVPISRLNFDKLCLSGYRLMHSASRPVRNDAWLNSSTRRYSTFAKRRRGCCDKSCKEKIRMKGIFCIRLLSHVFDAVIVASRIA